MRARLNSLRKKVMDTPGYPKAAADSQGGSVPAEKEEGEVPQ